MPLVADHLLEHAAAATGLDEFGSLGDGDWEAGSGGLVAAVNGSDLHVVGRHAHPRGAAALPADPAPPRRCPSRAPAIADEQIMEPVIVTGPARSGTTILFELLGLDPGLRTPRAADVLHPAEPDSTRPARLAMTECEQELWADIQPEFAAMHELRAGPSGRVRHDLRAVLRREPLADDPGRPRARGPPTSRRTSRSTARCCRRCSTASRRRAGCSRPRRT